jgi:hypothetical protein
MKTLLPRMSLLDIGKLPIAELARIAMREGARPRDAYQAHKWFARRFAVTARSLLVAAAADEKERFWPLFYKGNSWVGRTVLDPFVGGGVMLLEARRLGAKVFGSDIEPVAAAIAKFQTELRELYTRSGCNKSNARVVVTATTGIPLSAWLGTRRSHGSGSLAVLVAKSCKLTVDAKI